MTTNAWGVLSRAALTSLALCGCLSNDEQLIAPLSAPSGSLPGGPAPDDSAQRDGTVAQDPSGPADPAENSEEVGRAVRELGTAVMPDSPPARPTPVTPASPMSAPDAGEAAVPEVPAPGPCSAPGLLLCEDFESFPAGQFPSSDAWLRELAGCGSHLIDATGVSASGLKALRADAGGYPECMLHADVSGQRQLYVRSWVRLGENTSSTEQYITLLEFGPRAGQDEPELRIGVRSSSNGLCNGIPGLDVSISGLAGGPSTQCSGVRLEQERWYCLQAELKRNGRALDFSVQVDGAPAAARSYAGLDPAWDGDELYFKLGRASYGGHPKGSVWHDDVAIGDQPIPCNVSP